MQDRQKHTTFFQAIPTEQKLVTKYKYKNMYVILQKNVLLI